MDTLFFAGRLIALCAFLALLPRTSLAACEFPAGSSYAYCDTRGEAEAAATAACILSPTTGRVKSFQYTAAADRTYLGAVYNGAIASRQYQASIDQYQGCGGGANPNKSWFWRAGPSPTECQSRPPQSGWYKDEDPLTDDMYCDNGCMMSPIFNANNGTTQWEPTGTTCTVDPDNQPILDSDSDGTPDDDDAYPTDPDESADSDGDGVGDNNDHSPDDPDDGADDGTGDETDNTASGGGTCAAAPSCSGDGIACATLFQQWKARCSIDDMSKKVVGKLGELIAATNGNGTGDGDDEGPSYDSPNTTGAEGASPGDTDIVGTKNIGLDMLDDSGWIAKTCPDLPTFDMGSWGSYTPEIPGWCDLLETIGGIIMLISALIALRILVA